MHPLRGMRVSSDPSSSAIADRLLVVRCQLGEPAAFDALVQRWSPPLWRHAMAVTRDHDAAQDLVQDIWLRVLRNLHGLRQSERFRAWIFGIAHRALMDHLRGRYSDAHAAVDTDEQTVVADDSDETAGIDLAHGLAALPPVEREVIALFHLEQLSLVEISDALQIPLGTVKSRLFRARALLRRHFQHEEIHHVR